MGEQLEAKRAEIKNELYTDRIKLNIGELTDGQAELFLQLADTYLSDNKYDYPKAMAISHYVKKALSIKLANQKLSQEDKEIFEQDLQQVAEKINSIEGKFLLCIGKDPSESRSIEPHKKKLGILRNKVKTNLERAKYLGVIDDKLDEQELRERALRVEEIYTELRNDMIGEKGFIRDLFTDCMEEVGGLPIVKYCLLGMGSIALGTTTPWSDFEHSILIEDGLSKEEELRVREYFRDVS